MRYPGGKGKSYQQLINLMPPHATYIESHLGGGAVMRHKRPANRNIGVDIDAQVIGRWQKNFSNVCELIQSDAIHFLRSYHFVGTELVYADPPYLSCTRKRKRVYAYDYTTEQHEELLSFLCTLPCMVMISGYESRLYNDTLWKWRKTTFQSKTHTDVREECVWLNFPPPEALHDARYFGRTFRERQTVKRRQTRLHQRIRTMNTIERVELMKWMNKNFGQEVGGL
jgi:site-specific DNA-adenine methylase